MCWGGGGGREKGVGVDEVEWGGDTLRNHIFTDRQESRCTRKVLLDTG